KIAQKRVTNMQDSLSRQISVFKRARISPGVPPFPAVALKSVLVTAMKSDAGTPLPQTSPTAKHRGSLSMRKKSEKYHPTSFADAKVAKISNSLRSGNGGKIFGTMLI